mmetsp:Transcript_25402/g.47422  ORF Transcript_25402/g.47422 Transcript_25402/m.47422 type:complete len:110 (+) Transcript_25402:101-430(+)
MCTCMYGSHYYWYGDTINRNRTPTTNEPQSSIQEAWKEWMNDEPDVSFSKKSTATDFASGDRMHAWAINQRNTYVRAQIHILVASRGTLAAAGLHTHHLVALARSCSSA